MTQQQQAKTIRNKPSNNKFQLRTILAIVILGFAHMEQSQKVLASQDALAQLTKQQLEHPISGNQIDLLIKAAKEAETRGDLKTAEEIWVKAAASATSTETDQISNVRAGYIYAYLGHIKTLTGKLKEAELAKIEAIRIYEEALGPLNPLTTYEYQAIGTIYYRLGEYGKAEDYYKRTLAARALEEDEKSKLITITTTANLSSVYTQQGRLDKARAGFEEVLTQLKLRGDSNPELKASTLSNLGNIYRRLNEPEKALRLYQESLSIASNIGNDHQDIKASTREALASLEISKKQIQNPRQLLNETINNLEKKGTTNSTVYVQALRRMAYLESVENRFEEANRLYLKALEIYDRFLKNHADTGFTQLETALNEVNRGSPTTAYLYAIKGLQNIFQVARNEAPFLEASERDNFLASFDEVLQRIYTFAGAGEVGSKVAMTSRLNRQGLLQEIELNEKRLAGLAEIRLLVADIKKISVERSSPSLTPNERKALGNRLENLQAKLNQATSSLRYPQVTISDTAKAIQHDGVLIEYQRYQPMNNGKMGDQSLGDPKYVALILWPDSSIIVVHLGPAEIIDEAVLKALKATAEKQTDATSLWAQVSDLVVKPLMPHLSSSSQWFISPDGELNRVPFALLPSAQKPGVPLPEVVRLRQLTTGRELLRLQESAGYSEEPIVMANPAFDHDDTSTQSKTHSSNPGQGIGRSERVDGVIYPPLPETQLEADRISHLLRVKAITGIGATKTRLLKIKSPRVLHIATHGYFNPVLKLAAPPNKLYASKSRSSTRHKDDNPRTVVAIILAGANHSKDNPFDNGILTSEEAVELELKGTELVVLSACSTGLGDVRTGEGVYGLQRSLTVAGARSTLLSLWKVDDAATQEFMTRFYTRLKAGEGRADALAAVQKEFRNGISGKPDGWTAPYYWAAWQLVGDWRPIKGL